MVPGPLPEPDPGPDLALTLTLLLLLTLTRRWRFWLGFSINVRPARADLPVQTEPVQTVQTEPIP